MTKAVLSALSLSVPDQLTDERRNSLARVPELRLPENWPDSETLTDQTLRDYEERFVRLMTDRYGPCWQQEEWSEEDCLAEAMVQERLSALQDRLDDARLGCQLAKVISLV